MVAGPALSEGSGNAHSGFFISAIVLPLLAGIVMNMIESLADNRKNWRERLMKVAWDNCVLTVGLSGGILSNHEVAGKYLPNQVGAISVISVLGTLVIAVIIAHLRRHPPNQPPTGLRTLLALALSGAALAWPSYVAW